MEITLEKIELVKDRTGVTYAEAKAALEENDGSVVDAIIAIEETINSGEKSRGFGKKGEALFARIKEIVKKGNVSKIQVKKDGEIVLNVPVNAGLVGVVIAPIAAVVAVVAAFGFKCTIEIIKDDGTIIDVSDAVTDAMGTVAEKSSSVARDVKEQSAVIYQKGKDKAGEAINKIKKAGEDIEDIIDETEEEIEKMRSEDVNTSVEKEDDHAEADDDTSDKDKPEEADGEKADDDDSTEDQDEEKDEK